MAQDGEESRANHSFIMPRLAATDDDHHHQNDEKLFSPVCDRKLPVDVIHEAIVLSRWPLGAPPSRIALLELGSVVSGQRHRLLPLLPPTPAASSS